jgi:hypothetical protein
MKVMIEVATTSIDPKNDMMLITELKYYHLDSSAIPTTNNIIALVKDFIKSHKFRINPIIIEPEDKEESYISRVTYEKIKNNSLVEFSYDLPIFPQELNYITLGIYPLTTDNFILKYMGYPAEQLLRMSNKIITK